MKVGYHLLMRQAGMCSCEEITVAECTDLKKRLEN